jgi:serine/threonine protein kinase
MAELICKGCGGMVDAEGIEPFTLCECSDCGSEIIIPKPMGHFLLEKDLGTENYIRIYEGFDKEQNMDSYIFMLDKDCPEYDKFLALAKEDAVALSTLKHPNICPTLNFGEVEGQFFVTYPKLDGYSLSDYTPETQGLLDVNRVVDVVQAVGLGMAVAHHKEFAHHDICLKNIQIDARGNVRLKNFFKSRFIYNLLQNKDELTSSVSPFFISPEKAESRIEDKRGDVFSYGVVFYFMLTGKYPFSGATEAETVYSRVKKKAEKKEEVFNEGGRRLKTQDTVEYIPPPYPSKIREDIPDEISSLIMEMLSYHPVQRPKFTEILAAINLFKAKEEKEAVVKSVQKQIIREDSSTKTRAIPIMKNLAGADQKKQQKKRFFKL